MTRPTRFAYDDLVIRSYKIEDAPELLRASTSSYEHLKPWMPWASLEGTVETHEILIQRFIDNFARNEDYTMGIWIGDELVGGTGFHLRVGPVEWKNAEIGMWITQARSGKRIGTKALEAMLTWGFDEWQWTRLVWKCDVKNFASARVAEKCGLRREATHLEDALGVDGKPRDTYVYAILAREWQMRKRTV